MFSLPPPLFFEKFKNVMKSTIWIIYQVLPICSSATILNVNVSLYACSVPSLSLFPPPSPPSLLLFLPSDLSLLVSKWLLPSFLEESGTLILETLKKSPDKTYYALQVGLKSFLFSVLVCVFAFILRLFFLYLNWVFITNLTKGTLESWLATLFCLSD